MLPSEEIAGSVDIRTGRHKITGEYPLPDGRVVWVERDAQHVEHIMCRCQNCSHDEEVASGVRVKFVSSISLAEWHRILNGPNAFTVVWAIYLALIYILAGFGFYRLGEVRPETWDSLLRFGLVAVLTSVSYAALLWRIRKHLLVRRELEKREYVEKWAEEFFVGAPNAFAAACEARGRVCVPSEGYKVLKNSKVLMLPRKE